MPMLRSGLSSQTFHEINENSDCHNAEVKCKTDSLLGRYFANGKYSRGNSDGKGHFNLSVSESGFLNQGEKVSISPSATFRIPRGQCKFDKDGIDFAIRKSEQNNLPMQGHSESRSSIDPPTDETSREMNIDCSGSSSSSSSLQTHSERPNKKSPHEQVVPNLCCSVNESEEGAKLVDGELESLQWQITPLNPSESDNKFGCFKDRSGSSMSTGGAWTWQEAKSHINILELKAALLAIRTYVPIWEPVAIHLQ